MSSIKLFALDVDGVLTDGKFGWDADGNKIYKEFGPDDADALKLLRRVAPDLTILFFTQDKAGFNITKSRINHMGFGDECIKFMNAEERFNYIRDEWGFENSLYIGDSFLDIPLLTKCSFGFAPSNSSFLITEDTCIHKLKSSGGDRAVSEAIFFFLYCSDYIKSGEVNLFGNESIKLSHLIF